MSAFGDILLGRGGVVGTGRGGVVGIDVGGELPADNTDFSSADDDGRYCFSVTDGLDTSPIKVAAVAAATAATGEGAVTSCCGSGRLLSVPASFASLDGVCRFSPDFRPREGKNLRLALVSSCWDF